jgi:hypothetical protein
MVPYMQEAEVLVQGEATKQAFQDMVVLAGVGQAVEMAVMVVLLGTLLQQVPLILEVVGAELVLETRTAELLEALELLLLGI